MYEFPKSARLLSASQFVQVLRHPQVNLSRGPLRLRARKNRMPGARLGLVVTKRGTPKAFARNRAKRIIRESFRHAAATLPAADIVIQVFHQVDDEKLRFELEQAFAQLRSQTKLMHTKEND